MARLVSGVAALAAVLASAGSAYAQATGSEAGQARAACAAAAAAYFETTVEALDVDVRQQRTNTRVIRLDLEVTLADGSEERAQCVYRRKSEEVSSFEVKG